MKPIRFALPVLVAMTLAACADEASSPVAGAPGDAAPLLSAAPGRGIPGEYVVVLNEGANPTAVGGGGGGRPRGAGGGGRPSPACSRGRRGRRRSPASRPPSRPAR
jgi:hypothetical protein